MFFKQQSNSIKESFALLLDRFQTKYSSSRSIPSVFFVLFVSFFIALSSSSNPLVFLARDFCCFPFIWISVCEIFKLFPRFKSKLGFSFLFSLIFYIPEIFLFSNLQTRVLQDPKHYIVIYLFVAFIVYVSCSFIFGSIRVFDSVYLFDSKHVFKRLMLFAYLFWNSLFVMASVGKIDWIIASFLLVSFSDAGAYLVGSKIGKIKVSKISPNKTLEGYLVPLLVLSVMFIFAYFGYGLSKSTKLGYWTVIFPFLVIPLGYMGDLFFSFQKRILEIKDYGKLMGGQGGFWDRLDSHTFSLIFCSSILLILQAFTNYLAIK